MISGTNGRRWGVTAPAVAVLLLLAGCGSVDAPSSTSPSASATTTAPTAGSAPTAAPTATTSAAPTPSAAVSAPAPEPAPQPSVLPASEPVNLTIPSIDVSTDLLKLGLRENRSLEVPPGEPGSPASWYNQSPTPGERGPSVMLGHVNATDGGDGVFAGLRSLGAGDRIEVSRQDGSTAVFEFLRGETYMKNDFPTLEVYGNTAGSELRLITCDGYNPDTGEFDDNYVVYAALVG